MMTDSSGGPRKYQKAREYQERKALRALRKIARGRNSAALSDVLASLIYEAHMCGRIWGKKAFPSGGDDDTDELFGRSYAALNHAVERRKR